ncbi:MAG TPA: FKBP-type peptidyl-prolyl cis-trans isomerase [Candidatus Limnocylindrales bacterium]|nr:FKBP-type peptidyl-prolyl cis-trans isomerase [Candidatus Limnocylindrales bacterium]
MAKIKIVGIGIAVLAVLGGSGVGLWAWSGQGSKQPFRTSVAEAGAGSGGQTLGQSYDPNSVSLNKMQSKPEPSGGLSVSQNTRASNLGQISPNSDGLSGNSGSTSTPKPAIDPATFGQYDQYKDGDNAMYAEVQAGTGAELKPNMKAAVYYKGWLTNGQLFDASRPDDKGQLQPFVFELGAHQVISGWEQGLAGMKVGGTRLLIVPPSVGYGTTGQGPIPGNAVLVFQVQLLEVQ